MDIKYADKIVNLLFMCGLITIEWVYCKDEIF